MGSVARATRHRATRERSEAGSLVAAAEHLAERAVDDGWNADGNPGFVYTVDWNGDPVIRNRLHWVLCEGLGAAAMLRQATGKDRYARWYEQWWGFADRYLIDRANGSWHHELDAANTPSGEIRKGKADLYHALTATVIPRIDPSATILSALID